jgi:hypothetical protein
VLVGICDFPSAYEFPPHGYGGIERWLWAGTCADAALCTDAGRVATVGPASSDDQAAEALAAAIEATGDLKATMAVEPGRLAAQGARRSITQASPARR